MVRLFAALRASAEAVLSKYSACEWAMLPRVAAVLRWLAASTAPSRFSHCTSPVVSLVSFKMCVTLAYLTLGFEAK